MRITKLPSYADQFGKDGSWFAGVRQTRFGVKTATTAGGKDLTAKFEIDMFGTGGDAGQTTIRLRHAWGEWGAFGAGQTDSPFEDDEPVAEHGRVLGPDRHGVLPQRPAALDADQGRRRP